MSPFALLRDFNRSLASAKNASSIFQTAMGFLKKTININNGLMGMLQRNKGEVVVEEIYGRDLQGAKGNRCKMEQGNIGEAFRRGCSVQISDILEEPLLQGISDEVRRSGCMFICTPLRWGDIDLGVLVTDKSHPPSNEELRPLEAVASLISPALVLMRWADEIPLDEILRRKLQTAVERMDLHTESHGSLMADIISLVERTLITAALQKAGNVQLTAARFLGINRNTLRKKIKELGISPP